MSTDNSFDDTDGDDFEKLLNNFINSKVDDYDDEDDEDNTSAAKKKDTRKASAKLDLSIESEDEEDNDEDEEELKLSPEGEAENDKASEDFESELAETFEAARNVIEEEENKPELNAEESELAQAYINYQGSIDKICKNKKRETGDWSFSIDFLYPNYKPSVGQILAGDLIIGWNILCDIFPDTVGRFKVTASDEEFLNFAETLRDQDLQLAVISYVEILIDMESCELSYQAKLLKYQEKHIKRLLYEEYLERKERQRRFVEAVQKKDFPIDAERLISNYFRVAQKDVDGAFKALTTNPAIFAPIDFAKIKPRFFGLVKVTPKDGIRVNIEIGNFMKKLKV